MHCTTNSFNKWLMISERKKVLFYGICTAMLPEKEVICPRRPRFNTHTKKGGDQNQCSQIRDVCFITFFFVKTWHLHYPQCISLFPNNTVSSHISWSSCNQFVHLPLEPQKLLFFFSTYKVVFRKSTTPPRLLLYEKLKHKISQSIEP